MDSPAIASGSTQDAVPPRRSRERREAQVVECFMPPMSPPLRPVPTPRKPLSSITTPASNSYPINPQSTSSSPISHSPSRSRSTHVPAFRNQAALQLTGPSTSGLSPPSSHEHSSSHSHSPSPGPSPLPHVQRFETKRMFSKPATSASAKTSRPSTAPSRTGSPSNSDSWKNQSSSPPPDRMSFERIQNHHRTSSPASPTKSRAGSSTYVHTRIPSSPSRFYDSSMSQEQSCEDPAGTAPADRSRSPSHRPSFYIRAPSWSLSEHRNPVSSRSSSVERQGFRRETLGSPKLGPVDDFATLVGMRGNEDAIAVDIDRRSSSSGARIADNIDVGERLVIAESSAVASVPTVDSDRSEFQDNQRGHGLIAVPARSSSRGINFKSISGRHRNYMPNPAASPGVDAQSHSGNSVALHQQHLTTSSNPHHSLFSSASSSSSSPPSDSTTSASSGNVSLGSGVRMIPSSSLVSTGSPLDGPTPSSASVSAASSSALSTPLSSTYYSYPSYSPSSNNTLILATPDSSLPPSAASSYSRRGPSHHHSSNMIAHSHYTAPNTGWVAPAEWELPTPPPSASTATATMARKPSRSNLAPAPIHLSKSASSSTTTLSESGSNAAVVIMTAKSLPMMKQASSKSVKSTRSVAKSSNTSNHSNTQSPALVPTSLSSDSIIGSVEDAMMTMESPVEPITLPNESVVTGGGGSLVRKVSRKLSKRPKKLDLAPDTTNSSSSANAQEIPLGSTSISMTASSGAHGMSNTTMSTHKAVVEARGKDYDVVGKVTAVAEDRLALRPIYGIYDDGPDDGVLVGEGNAQMWVFGGSAATQSRMTYDPPYYPPANSSSAGRSEWEAPPRSYNANMNTNISNETAAPSSNNTSSSSKFSRMIRKLSTPSLKDAASKPGNVGSTSVPGTPRRGVMAESELPPVPSIPATASLSTPTSSSRNRSRFPQEDFGTTSMPNTRHVRRASSVTDFGMLVQPSISSSSHPGHGTGGHAPGGHFHHNHHYSQYAGLPSRSAPFADFGDRSSPQILDRTPDRAKVKSQSANNTPGDEGKDGGYLSRVFGGGSRKRVPSFSSRHESETTTTGTTTTTSSSGRSGSAYSRPSTSSLHPDEYYYSYPSEAVPPLPLPQSQNQKTYSPNSKSSPSEAVGDSTYPYGLTSATMAGPTVQAVSPAPSRRGSAAQGSHSASPNSTVGPSASAGVGRRRGTQSSSPPGGDDAGLASPEVRTRPLTLEQPPYQQPGPRRSQSDHHLRTSSRSAALNPLPPTSPTPVPPLPLPDTSKEKPRSSSHGRTKSKSAFFRKRLASFSKKPDQRFGDDDPEEREREAQLDFLINRASEKLEERRLSTTKRDTRIPAVAPSSVFPWANAPAAELPKPRFADEGEKDDDGLTTTVTVASFVDALGATSRKTALEKDLMWEELMRRSDRAPGGTLHAQLQSTLPSDQQTEEVNTDVDASSLRI